MAGSSLVLGVDDRAGVKVKRPERRIRQHHAWPAESTNQSRSNHSGSTGTEPQEPGPQHIGGRANAMAVPGWPLPAFWMASMARTRAVSTASRSRSTSEAVSVSVASLFLFRVVPAGEDPAQSVVVRWVR